MAELADAPDLGSGPARGGGSSPPFRTNNLAPAPKCGIRPRVWRNEAAWVEKACRKPRCSLVIPGPEGARLRAIATLGDQSQRTAKAIAWVRANYAKPLRVEDLARIAGMGVSTLHHHFRGLTALSPLQYQKQLRLHAARERMLMNGLDAASAAFEVGYESASQFNREYSRFFGQPPCEIFGLFAHPALRRLRRLVIVRTLPDHLPAECSAPRKISMRTSWIRNSAPGKVLFGPR